MKLKKYYNYALLILSILIVVIAPQRTLAGSKSDVFEIIESSDTRIVFALKPYQLNFEVKAGNLTDCYVPSIDGFHSMNNPGKPQLPMYGILVGIPEHANPAIELLEIQTSQLKPRKIYPAPSLELSGEGDDAYLEESFSIDEKLYSSNGFYPEKNVIITSIGYFRGHRIARIEIRPIQYNPATDDLKHVELLKFAVYYNQTETAPNRGAENDPLDLISRRLIKNYPVARNWKVTPKARQLTKTSYGMNTNWYNPDNIYYKLAVDEDGVYGLDYAYLDSLGVPVDEINPQTVKVYLRGEEIPLYVKGEEDTAFDPGDYIAFYGERNDGDTTYYNLYSDENIYWLTWGNEPGLRMQERSSLPNSDTTVATYMEKIHLEEDNYYHRGDNSIQVINTEMVEGEGWVWKYLYGGDSHIIKFEANKVAYSEEECGIQIKLRGTTLDYVTPNHHFEILLNNHLLGDGYLNDTESIIYQTSFAVNLLEEGENKIEIKSLGDTGAELDQIYLDWVELQYPRLFIADHDQLNFKIMMSKTETAKLELWDFSGPNIKIFDVTDQEIIQPNEISPGKKINFRIVSAGNQDGDFVRMFVNENRIVNNGNRGHNLAVIDETTGQPIEIRNFDTHGSTYESDSMAAYIQRIPQGRFVLVGIRDEGSYSMTEAAHSALESLGSQYTRSVGYRDSWAMIGKKGAAAGSVQEMKREATTGVAQADTTMIVTGIGENYVVFNDLLEGEKSYFALEESFMKKPVRMKLAPEFQLTNNENGADYIIITHKNFVQSAERLAEFRSSRNKIRTAVIDIDNIIDEFNFGIYHPIAIKKFLNYAYQNWQAPSPSYLVLFGDASWDYKNNLGESNKENFVPSYGSPVSDNWFVCFDGADDFLPEMLVGRIPVEDERQAEYLIDKVIEYENTSSERWKKNVLFITGGFSKGEQATFISQANYLIDNYIIPEPASCNPLSINKTTEGYFEGEKKEEILNAMNTGVLWINFIGHAGSNTWDLMFNHPDIEELTNRGKYPFITSMTCHTGRFANPEITSFGEHFVITENKGAIGFWGTTGWGYVFQDNVLLRHLFSTTMIDTSHLLGEATTYSKFKLWEELGTNIYNISTIHQYTLIGDPIANLTLPEKPDLTIQQENIEFEPNSPVEADSTVLVKFEIENWGLATPDSFSVDVYDFNKSENSTTLIEQVRTPPVGLNNTYEILWDITSKAAEHEIIIKLDSHQEIAEVEESNNENNFPIYIYSSVVQISRPLPFQVVDQNQQLLQVYNPVKFTGDEIFVQFEIDTTSAFNSPIKLVSHDISLNKIVTAWKITNLVDKNTYYWRCRTIEDNTYGNWVGSSFSTDFGQQILTWKQQADQMLSNSKFNIKLTNAGSELEKQTLIFRVQSAGNRDGSFARAFVNSTALIEAFRGHNLAVVDQFGNPIISRSFDTNDRTSAADSMAALITDVEQGHYVLIAIKDDGISSMTESAYQALESIGSQYCRDVGFRDSWAIIGIKGAPIGSVKEQHVPATQGFAAVEDTLINYRPRGTMTSTVIGPSNGWNTLMWEKDDSGPGTLLSLNVLGFNKKNSLWDTLLTGLSETSVELNSIDAVVHPKIKLQSVLTDDDGLHTPVLKNWAVSYDPVSDPAIAPEVVSVSLDTLLEGDALQVDVDVHNVGMAPIDSVLCRFSSTLLNSSNPPFQQDKYVSSIAVDSFRTAPFVWNSTATAGRYKITVEIDPENAIDELTELNNYFSDEIVVLPDTTDPGLVVTYDGKHIMDGDFISNQPTIIVSVFDDSRLQFKDDTTRIRLFLNDEPVHYSGFDSRLTVLSMPTENDSALKTRIRFTPELKDGRHTLEYFIQDASDNLIYHRDEFRVTSELQLVNVMNFPNPFDDHTDFTFYLTKYADRLNIKIYTIAGRLIRKIERHHLEAGFYHIYWNGRDEDRDEIANGVYLYKIIATSGGKQVEALEKLVIMR